MAEENTVQVNITAGLKGLFDGLAQAVTGVRSATGQMSSAFAGMSGAVSALKGPLLGLGAILGGGALFKSAVNEAIQWNEQARKSAQQLGITTEAASTLAVALDDIGIEMSTYNSIARMFAFRVAAGGTALKEAGISLKDHNGQMKDTPQLIQEAINHINRLPEGTAQMTAGIKMFGRAWGQNLDLLKMTPEIMMEAEDKARRLGLLVGEQGAAQARKYTLAMRDVSDVMQSLKVQVGNAVLPVLLKMAEWFGSQGPAMGERFTQYIDQMRDALSHLWPAVEGTIEVLSELWKVVGPFAAEAFRSFITTLSLIFDALTVVMDVVSSVLAAFRRLVAFIRDEVVGTMKSAAESVLSFFGKTKKVLEDAGFLIVPGAIAKGVEKILSPLEMASNGFGALAKAAKDAYEKSLGGARAAEEQKKLTAQVEKSTKAFQEQSEYIGRLEAVTKSATASDETKRRAQEKISEVMARLTAQFPALAKFMLDEAGNSRTASDALRLFTEEQKKKIAQDIEEAKAVATKAEMKLRDAEASAQAAAAAKGPGMGAAEDFAAKQARRELEAAREALKNLQGAADALSPSLKKAMSAAAVPDMGGGKKVDVVAQFKSQLDALKLQEQNWFAWSKDQEIAFWEAKLKTIRGKGAESVRIREQIRQELAKLEKAQAQEAHEAALKAMGQEGEEAGRQGDFEGQLAAARRIIESQKSIYGEGSKEVAAAREEFVNTERAVNEKLAALRTENIESARQHHLDLLAVEEDRLRAAKENGEIGEVEALTGRIEIQQQRYAAEVAANERLAETENLSFEQRRALHARALDADRDHKLAMQSLAQEHLQAMAAIEARSVEQQRQYAEQRIAERQKEMQRSQSAFNLEENALGARRGRREIGDEEYTQGRIGIEQGRFDANMGGLQGQLDEAVNDEQRASINAAIEAEQTRHVAAMQQLDEALVNSQIAAKQAFYETWTGEVFSSLQSALEQMLAGTQKFSDAMRSLALSIAQGFQKASVEMVTTWIQNKLRELVMTRMVESQKGMAAQQGAAMQQAAAAQSSAASTASATKEIAASAGKAGAKAAESQAGVPIVGPALALGAMAMVFAAVMALSGKIFSAAGGFDIPKNMDPLVQAHGGEKILPRKQSEGIDRVIDQQMKPEGESAPMKALNVTQSALRSISDKVGKATTGMEMGLAAASQQASAGATSASQAAAGALRGGAGGGEGNSQPVSVSMSFGFVDPTDADKFLERQGRKIARQVVKEMKRGTV